MSMKKELATIITLTLIVAVALAAIAYTQAAKSRPQQPAFLDSITEAIKGSLMGISAPWARPTWVIKTTAHNNPDKTSSSRDTLAQLRPVLGVTTGLPAIFIGEYIWKKMFPDKDNKKQTESPVHSPDRSETKKTTNKTKVSHMRNATKQTVRFWTSPLSMQLY